MTKVRSRTTSFYLFILSSPTVSTESSSRSEKICDIGEILVDFKLMCDEDGTAASPLPQLHDCTTLETTYTPSTDTLRNE